MSTSAGFIIRIPDENTFYTIKKFVENLPESRLIYCTRNSKKLYITTEEEMTNR